MRKFKVFLLFTIYLFTLSLIEGLFTIAPADAITMSNNNYILHMGNFNMTSGKETSSKYQVVFTAGETAPGLYIGKNYKLRAGFSYARKTSLFSFSISETLIDFGTITATNPVTRTNTLTVFPGSAHSYSVSVSENHELTASSSATTIPDTTCDNGQCTEEKADTWNNTLTYGLGYRCDNIEGKDCSPDFSSIGQSKYYKMFANTSKGKKSKSIMSGTNQKQNKKVQITYKVNISGTQAGGFYSNLITYIAAPAF